MIRKHRMIVITSQPALAALDWLTRADLLGAEEVINRLLIRERQRRDPKVQRLEHDDVYQQGSLDMNDR